MCVRTALIGSLVIGALLSSPASPELYKRAPDVVPGTLPEMHDPAYWIGRMENPDEVILTLAGIRARNAAYFEKMSVPEPFAGVHEGRVPMDWQLNRWPGRFVAPPDIGSMNAAERAALIREQIQACSDYIRAESYGNYLGVEYSPADLDAIAAETAIEAVSALSPAKKGITVRAARLRVIPAPFPHVVGIENIDTTNYTVDLWTAAVAGIGTPVTALHHSMTGSHLFVMADHQFGWIAAEDIAFADPGALSAYTDADDFYLCTGDRAPYYTGEDCLTVSGWYRMGDRIPKAPGGNDRLILAPSRAVDGSFTAQAAWLAPDADVHEGYVPYTRRNIVTLAFKLLGDPYDWTGSTLGRNHETTYGDIFSCFGIELPHNGGLYTHYGDIDDVAVPGIGQEATYRMTNSREPFVSFAISRGHAMLLLGEHNGVPVAFDQNGYSYTDDDEVTWHVKRCSIITPSVVGYFLTYPVTFLEVK